MKRDPLLGPPPVSRRSGPLEVVPRDRGRWRNKARWISAAHFLFLIAALIGWEHLDIFWPRSIVPNGIALGAPKRMAGFLTVGDRGRPARLTTSAGLLADWHHWVEEDERQDSSRCIGLSDSARRKLIGGSRPRPGTAGLVQYWVEVEVSDRLAPAQCRQSGGLQIMSWLDKVDSIRPIPCSREVFVAYGFVCPGERRSAARLSETFDDTSSYYPNAALRAGDEGTVRVKVERDATGSPIQCAILTSSGHDELDRQTCKLVGTDPDFTFPSKNAARGDLSRPITQTVRWRLPPDEPAKH